MAAEENGEATTLEYTPTWVVAAVYTLIVVICLAVERLIHWTGTYLERKQRPVYEAFLKIKEELMLLGFISLLLTVLQGWIAKFCIPKHFSDNWLPCKREDVEYKHASSPSTSHFQISVLPGIGRHLLSKSSASADYCPQKGMVPLLSITALHHLHIFIFVLAIVHVTFCVLTMAFGGAKIRQWKWEDTIQAKMTDTEEALGTENMDSIVKGHLPGGGKSSSRVNWLRAFFKQFNVFASVTKSDYIMLRLGFIMTHCRKCPRYNFHRYIIDSLEAEFKTVVGISWYLWIFVIIFLLLDVHRWHAYFWISFLPFILMLGVGTMLEHVVIQLGHDVAERYEAITKGNFISAVSAYDHFCLRKPQIILVLIHIILFQNSFEMAFFFWIFVQYGLQSCIMGKIVYIIPRLAIGVFVQFMCSYSILPLYAIVVTQMQSTFRKAIFEEHMQYELDDCSRKVKKGEGYGLKTESNRSNRSNRVSHVEDSPIFDMEDYEAEANAVAEIEVLTRINEPNPTS